LFDPRRIFIGLTEVAGYFSGLREGFERLGFEVHQVNESIDPYGYTSPSAGSALGTIAERLHLYERRTSGLRGRVARTAQWGVRAARLPLRIVTFSEAMRRCDLFVFGGYSSFLGGQDLKVLRQAGKRIVWVFTGSDHRPAYLNGKIVRECAGDTGRLLADVRATRARVQHIERLSHAIIAHGPSAHFHARPFAEFLSVGAPVQTIPESTDRLSDGVWPGPPGVRILHCPTDAVKGSAIIRSIVGRLAERGLQISYLELAGRPNSEVRSRIGQADLVVDEVFSDTPMALFATEAATAGVPAVIGGYWAREIRADFPSAAIPPSAFVHPDDLESVVGRLVIDASGRRELGRRAREFVTDNWRPERVAMRVLALAVGDTTDVIIRNPADLTYCAGWGMPIEAQRDVIRQVLATGGRQGLGLSHNPKLEERMVATAEERIEGRT
jgi:hypothetical protein